MKKLTITLWISALLISVPLFVSAVENSDLPEPPIINFYNKNISNNEIFYINGTATFPRAEVIIYFQQESGALFSQTVKTDERGRWFYSHPEFLARGKYIIWTQLRVKDLVSPPSPQINVQVDTTALQIGNQRIGFGVLSAWLLIIFVLISAILLLFIFYHFRQHKHKSHLLAKELGKAEAMVHYGFVALKKDLLEELAFLRDKQQETRDKEIDVKEKQILKDLAIVEQHIDQELARIARISYPHNS